VKACGVDAQHLVKEWLQATPQDSAPMPVLQDGNDDRLHENVEGFMLEVLMALAQMRELEVTLPCASMIGPLNVTNVVVHSGTMLALKCWHQQQQQCR